MDNVKPWSNPLVIAGGAATFLVTLVIVAVALTGGSGGSEGSAAEARSSASPTLGADQLVCSSGSTARSEVTVSGKRFKITGEVRDLSSERIVIRTVEGDREIAVSANATSDGGFLAGDWMTAEGQIAANDEWVISEITSPCGNGGETRPFDANETPNRTPARSRGSDSAATQPPATAPTAAPIPVETAEPTKEPKPTRSEDEGDDDDDASDDQPETRTPQPTVEPTPGQSEPGPSATDSSGDSSEDHGRGKPRNKRG